MIKKELNKIKTIHIGSKDIYDWTMYEGKSILIAYIV